MIEMTSNRKFFEEDEYYDEYEYLNNQIALEKGGEKYEFAVDFYEDTPPLTPPKTPTPEPTPRPKTPTPEPTPRYVPKIRYYSDVKPIDSDKYINYPVKQDCRVLADMFNHYSLMDGLI